MISLLSAAYLLGAAAIAVPIILHLLRRRPRKVQPFPSFLLIDPTTARMQSQNNILKWLVLLLRCLFLLLLALAFSWPYLPRFKRPPEQLTAVLWDHSFSMQSRAYANELYEKAQDIIGKGSQGHPTAVGLVADRVRWSGDFSEDPDSLAQWFYDHESGYGSSKFDRALRLADRKLQNAPGRKKRIVLITDRQLVPWQGINLSKTLSPGTEFELIEPQRPGFKNVAITDARLVGPFTDPKQRLPLRVRIRNYQHQPVIAELVITWQDEIADRRQIEVDALSQVTVAIPLEAEMLEPLFGKAEILVSDELQADNTAWFVANPTHLPKVYMSRPRRGSVDFIHTALAPTDRRKAAQLEELSGNSNLDELQSSDVIIVHRGIQTDSPLAERLDQRLRQGGTIVAVWRDTPMMRRWLAGYGLTAAASPLTGTHRLGSIDFEHPVFMPFLDVRTASLFNVLFFDPPHLKLPERARVLAHFDSGQPAIAELPVDDGRLIIVGTAISREATDWPINASFLPLWRELLAYANQDQQTQSTFTVSASALNIPKITQVRNMHTGEIVPLQAKRFIPDQPGAYLVQHAGEDTAIAVNVPSEESDPLPLADDFPYQRLVSKEPPSEQDASVLTTAQQSKSFWWMLLSTALVMMLAEIILANRTSL